MAITSITWIQDNKAASYEYIMAIHNPLIFIVEANYTSTAPTGLDVYLQMYGSGYWYSAIPYSDPQAGKRQFMFSASEIIRGKMEAFDDYYQNGLAYLHEMQTQVDIRFFDPANHSTIYSDQVSIYALHAARQFSENPNILAQSIYGITKYLGIVGSPCYVYLFNYDISKTITITES